MNKLQSRFIIDTEKSDNTIYSKLSRYNTTQAQNKLLCFLIYVECINVKHILLLSLIREKYVPCFAVAVNHKVK